MGFSITTQVIPYSEPVRQVSKHVDTTQLKCMAQNIFYEAQNESHEGQAAVARVVINRMKHGFGKTPCHVVLQSRIITVINDSGEVVKVKQCQFSWTCVRQKTINTATKKYKQAEQIAYNVLVNDSYSNVVPKSALFFHSALIAPMWAYRQVAVIGNHIFYAKPPKENK